MKGVDSTLINSNSSTIVLIVSPSPIVGYCQNLYINLQYFILGQVLLHALEVNKRAFHSSRTVSTIKFYRGSFPIVYLFERIIEIVKANNPCLTGHRGSVIYNSQRGPVDQIFTSVRVRRIDDNKKKEFIIACC